MITLPIRPKSIYSSILIFNIFLVIFTSLMPQILFINYFTNTFDNEIKKQSTQNVKKLQYSVDETILNRVINFTNDYFSDYASNLTLTYPLTHNINQDTTKISEVSNTLADVRNKQNFIDSVEVLYTKGNIYFEDSNVTMLDFEASAKGLDESWLKVLAEPGVSMQWISSRKIDWKSSQDVVTYISTIPSLATAKSRQAIVAINLKKSAIYNLVRFTEPHEGEELFIIDENGSIIVQGSQSRLSKELSNKENIQKLLGSTDSNIIEAKINGERCIVSFSKSSYNNWRYVSIISTDSLFKKTSQIKEYLIFICILMLFINILISVVATKRVNKPFIAIVKKIKNIGSNIANYEHGRESEYTILNSVLNNVTEKITDLNKQLEESKPIITDKIIMRLLKGEINENLDAMQYSQFLNTGDDYSKVTCCIMKISSAPDIGLEDELIIKYSIIEFFKNEIYYNCNVTLDEQGNVVSIISYDNEMDYQEIVNKLSEHIKCKFILCFGKEYSNSLEVISQSYIEACECLKYSYMMPNVNLLKYGDLLINELNNSGSTPRILEKLSSAIKNNNLQSTFSTLDAILYGLIKGRYTIQYCTNTLFDIVSTVRTAFIDMGYNLETILGYDIREYFKKIENIDEFKEWIYKLIEGILTYKETQFNTGNELKEKISEYINTNILNNISLTSLSDGINMNSCYVSRIFKSVMGMNFSEYIMEIKMLYAQNMLKETKLSVQEISDKLGYTSPRYFVKVFKDKYGCTPKEYQKSTKA